MSVYINQPEHYDYQPTVVMFPFITPKNKRSTEVSNNMQLFKFRISVWWQQILALYRQIPKTYLCFVLLPVLENVTIFHLSSKNNYCPFCSILSQ